MIRYFFVFFALSLLASCATTTGPMRNLPPAPDILRLAGFSFQRPEESNWMLAGSSRAKISIIRPGIDIDESFVIQAFIHPLRNFTTDRDFLHEMTANLDTDTNPRFEHLSRDSSLIPYKHGQCVRIAISKRDLQAVTRSGNRGPMLMNTLSIICRHREHPEIAVTFGASHRYRSPASASALNPSVDYLLNHLSMTKLDFQAFDYLGIQATRTGDYQTAANLLQTALSLATENSQAHAELARIRFNLARAMGYNCNFANAEALFLSSIKDEIEYVGEDSKMLSGRYFELARLYVDQYKYALAIPYFERAVALLDDTISAQDPIGFALVLEDYAKALHAENRAEQYADISARIQQLRQDNAGKQARFEARHYNTECVRSKQLNH